MSAIIAFDTSGPEIAIGVMAGGKSDIHTEHQPRGQGEVLFALCERLMASTGVAWEDLNAIGVGVGPGNFTGIRISVSAARGLALGLAIPAIGISRFETTARLAPGHGAYSVSAMGENVYLAEGSALGAPRLVPATGAEGAAAAGAFGATEHMRAMLDLTKARMRAQSPLTSPPKPLYIKPADAAPPRDAPPSILD
ncbi:MAG: tRNA (adenosine(37)-N6)-threonylcarbamoyltransferase complex dimerization subunit type 1 TsaB [Pseudomonadota bacterium]